MQLVELVPSRGSAPALAVQIPDDLTYIYTHDPSFQPPSRCGLLQYYNVLI
jgi:hypothetical protein